MSENYSRIFLLSHMRAFTSLAGHILGSHPSINGYFEMHISYEDASALDKQLEVLQGHETLKLGSYYIFDKLLHNDYRLNHEQLKLTSTKILISLLEPEQTIKSIVDLFKQKDTEELYAAPVEATKYYLDRIKSLADYCQTVETDYYYYDAEMFQAAPETLLPKISSWLELDSPLSERYQVFSQTGKAGKGDSSKHIHSGKIDRKKIDYSHVSIPRAELNRALDIYQECRQLIIENASESVLY